MVRDLQNDCSAEGASFDSWAKKYRTTGDLYNKFQPCSGRLIEEETKKTIKFCYCFNFCGTEQVYNGCEVEGLEGRLDLGANLFSSYRAMYVPKPRHYVHVSVCVLFESIVSYIRKGLSISCTLHSRKRPKGHQKTHNL